MILNLAGEKISFKDIELVMEKINKVVPGIMEYSIGAMLTGNIGRYFLSLLILYGTKISNTCSHQAGSFGWNPLKHRQKAPWEERWPGLRVATSVPWSQQALCGKILSCGFSHLVPLPRVSANFQTCLTRQFSKLTAVYPSNNLLSAKVT